MGPPALSSPNLIPLGCFPPGLARPPASHHGYPPWDGRIPGPLRSQTGLTEARGEGTGLPSEMRFQGKGATPKTTLGAPLKAPLGRAPLSGPTKSPWPGGGSQSRHRGHLGDGRRRGLGAPQKGTE